MSSAEAMKIAESLYQKGFISYPRTETNAFPKTMNMETILQKLTNSETYTSYINKLLH
jgi:DNA topoisomerase-3